MTLTVYFFYCNGRHHTFAFGKLPGPKKLHHFMLQTNSMDDVGLAYDRFDAERAIVMTLGRHTNDHMVSFYGATPSGFAVEYRSEEHTSELQSLMRISYAFSCLKTK